MVAQELQRELQKASANHAVIEGLGGADKLGKASLIQQATPPRQPLSAASRP
jgi:hypothetical protein